LPDDDVLEAQLLAVFDHYDIPEPRFGEHPLRCPIHDDRVASASVNRGRGVWFCHACGRGGTAVHLVMERESMDFCTALAFVAGMTGLTPPTAVRPKRRVGRWIPPRLRKGQ